MNVSKTATKLLHSADKFQKRLMFKARNLHCAYHIIMFDLPNFTNKKEESKAINNLNYRFNEDFDHSKMVLVFTAKKNPPHIRKFRQQVEFQNKRKIPVFVLYSQMEATTGVGNIFGYYNCLRGHTCEYWFNYSGENPLKKLASIVSAVNNG
ncbi:unnamed protein product, partial [Allacma fusca]